MKDYKDLLRNDITEALEKDLNDKTLSVSYGQLADCIMRNADFSDPTLAHKGVNWHVKELLKQLNKERMIIYDEK